jgi:hypothetical protein
MLQAVRRRRSPTILDARPSRAALRRDVLGQFRMDGLEPWDDVPFLDEHPFFAPQTRWVLANCGLIDPDQHRRVHRPRRLSRALAKALRETRRQTPRDVGRAAGSRSRRRRLSHGT